MRCIDRSNVKNVLTKINETSSKGLNHGLTSCRPIYSKTIPHFTINIQNLNISIKTVTILIQSYVIEF